MDFRSDKFTTDNPTLACSLCSILYEEADCLQHRNYACSRVCCHHAAVEGHGFVWVFQWCRQKTANSKSQPSHVPGKGFPRRYQLWICKLFLVVIDFGISPFGQSKNMRSIWGGLDKVKSHRVRSRNASSGVISIRRCRALFLVVTAQPAASPRAGHSWCDPLSWS